MLDLHQVYHSGALLSTGATRGTSQQQMTFLTTGYRVIVQSVLCQWVEDEEKKLVHSTEESVNQG